MHPIILISAGLKPGGGFRDVPRIRPILPEVYTPAQYVEAVRRAGGVPLLLPPGEPQWAALLAAAHGVVLTGGAADIHPRHYGQTVLARLDTPDEDKTTTELALARACIAQEIPVLGICGGLQALAVASGGTLIQDIHTARPDALQHEQPTDPREGWHQVEIQNGALVHSLGHHPVVNSTHHQALDNPGQLTPTAWAPDGIIEAAEIFDHPFCVGVQWHPELIQAAPYRLLIEAACRR